jgi:gliding motility-associated-like protein
VSIYDGYISPNSLISVSHLPKSNLFFFGAFDKMNGSLNQFTDPEIDALYQWSLGGGKLIIAESSRLYGIDGVIYDPSNLSSKWGFNIEQGSPSSINATNLGASTTIFNGVFGTISSVLQGGAAQGYFDVIPLNSSVLATDDEGRPTLILDCTTMDLIVTDVDAYTDFGAVTMGPNINNDQDIFWANTIAFMDQLDTVWTAPTLNVSSDTLSVASSFYQYQWYLNDEPIIGANDPQYITTQNGLYYAEVTLLGGCKSKSNFAFYDSFPIDIPVEEPGVDTLVMPNVFSPNNDGVGDFFKPIKISGYHVNEITVYNRWGSMVHQEMNPDLLWDGHTAHEHASEGVYYWVMDYQNKKGILFTKSGMVQLGR